MPRVVIDTNLSIDGLNEGRHENVLAQRDAAGAPHLMDFAVT